MARLSSLSGHREVHSIGSSSGSAFFNLSQWHFPVPQPGQHDLWPLRHLQPSLWGNSISLMGIENISRNESTKLNDPDIPQSLFICSNNMTGVFI